MGDLSPNFSTREFACKCGCGFGSLSEHIDPRLIDALEILRSKCGDRRIRINSGCRCQSHNRAVGGAPTSQHLLGRAADISIDGIDPVEVARRACRVDAFYRGGIKAYPSWTHVDVRDNGPWHEGF